MVSQAYQLVGSIKLHDNIFEEPVFTCITVAMNCFVDNLKNLKNISNSYHLKTDFHNMLTTLWNFRETPLVGMTVMTKVTIIN